MRTLYREAIEVMARAFRRLEEQVPKPVQVIIRGGPALRYEDRTPQQAVILKLARYISGLNAIDVLLLNGYVQEQALIQRTLDEIDEDLTFLFFGIRTGLTKVHRAYLKSFWQEEFDDDVPPIDSTKSRYSKRKEVREYLLKIPADSDPRFEKSMRVITQDYSGYVHAAAPHIMEMCGGSDNRFHLSGLRGTSRMADHVEDAWNCVYRGLLVVRGAAVVFADEPLSELLKSYLCDFERKSGTTYMADINQETAHSF